NRISRIVAGFSALTIAVAAAPAFAQSQDYSIAKVIKQGTTTQPIAGSGTVLVQVQVNADGTHKVVKILKSDNTGDNAAAMEIAQTSTYRPARRGSTPITTFYDFSLRFNGKSAQTPEENAISSGGGDTAAIDALVRSGKYKDAIAKANAALLASPGNPAVLQLLGVAQYYDNDYVEAATTFNRVDDIKKPFQPIAAQAFATGAVRVSSTDPSQSLDFAHKAMALSGDNTSKFALGVAELANKQYPDALTTLKSVHDQVTDKAARLNIDTELLQGYLATNDSADAQATANEMKSLDPSGTGAQRAVAQHYLAAGNDAMKAADYAGALKDFDQAASAGSAPEAVTANTFAAFAIMSGKKPDYDKAKEYALKAVSASPDDVQANFAAGVAYANIYVTSKKTDDKTQALTYLKKSDQLAKAAGNEGLALQIESQIKNVPQ
ncbi:MAG: tetratricopeptide repeat protein, partial [Candidatus Aquilonibacter sp.]